VAVPFIPVLVMGAAWYFLYLITLVN